MRVCVEDKLSSNYNTMLLKHPIFGNHIMILNTILLNFCVKNTYFKIENALKFAFKYKSIS